MTRGDGTVKLTVKMTRRKRSAVFIRRHPGETACWVFVIVGPLLTLAARTVGA